MLATSKHVHVCFVYACNYAAKHVRALKAGYVNAQHTLPNGKCLVQQPVFVDTLAVLIDVDIASCPELLLLSFMARPSQYQMQCLHCMALCHDLDLASHCAAA